MVRQKLIGFAHAAFDVVEVLSGLAFTGRHAPAFDAARAVVGGESPAGLPQVAPEPAPTFEQWGLKLPDGNVVWENCLYKGLPLQTLEQRTAVVAVLRKTAAELDFEESVFLGHYGWAHRLGVPAVHWGDIVVFPLAIQEQEAHSATLEPSDGTESVVPK